MKFENLSTLTAGSAPVVPEYRDGESPALQPGSARSFETRTAFHKPSPKAKTIQGNAMTDGAG
jgi:hypothetical protein